MQRGEVEEERACLSALRFVANLSGDAVSERKFSKELLRIAANWFDVYWLGWIAERAGEREEAHRLYLRAERLCAKDDPDRDIVVSSLRRLSGTPHTGHGGQR